MGLWLTIAVIVLIVGYLIYRQYRKICIRKELASKLLDSVLVGYIEKNVPFYNKLPAELQVRLQGLVNAFLAEKRFEGCGGLEITDEIRVTIASQACILILNQPIRLYSKLETILVYPNSYLHGPDSDGIILGESWQNGPVVLSWDDVIGGARNVADGRNVVMHEFAHQLDQEDGSADGAPILSDGGKYSAWSQVLSDDYSRMCESERKGQASALNSYGATNPAEFFAVATETFFEKPQKLAKKNPELYEQLKDYYQLDPLTF